MTTPWTSETALELARRHIEDDDEFNGAFIIGAPDVVGITPCLETPRETGAMIALQMLAGKLPHADWLAFIGDTYHIELDKEDDHPGSLQDAFLAGDPRVNEAAVTMCVCPDGPSYHTIQTYTRTDHGIEWDEPVVRDSMDGTNGVIYHLMMTILTTPNGIAPSAADGIEQYKVEI